jgi:Phytanoyl-CoA dioxygenase (PhyH)
LDLHYAVREDLFPGRPHVSGGHIVVEELYEKAWFARLVVHGDCELVGIQDKIIEVQDTGYCVLREHFARPLIDACRGAFWPALLAYLRTHGHEPNRGRHRHFLPMPFEPPCFAPDFFLDNDVLSIVRSMMDDRVVADQWGCDVPLRGSDYQGVHVDYQRPLFSEAPDLSLFVYALVVSFGLDRITPENGAIEIAPGTHRMPRKEALQAVESSQIGMQPVPLEIGDVLIRHPWALHRGSPNTTDTPRALVSIRYVRPWYADSSREVESIPHAVWGSLTPAHQRVMRFPVED